jgi:hypothetical protein
MPDDRNFLSLDASIAIPTCVLRFEVSRSRHRKLVRPVTHRSDQPSAAALRSWICGSTKEPSGFMVNHWKPCGLGVASRQSPLMTWPPRRLGLILALRLNQGTGHNFVLPFLPPCDPHLIPLATESLKPILLVCFTLGGLTDIELSRLFFTCTSTNQDTACT